jgi:hypothetical protein
MQIITKFKLIVTLSSGKTYTETIENSSLLHLDCYDKAKARKAQIKTNKPNAKVVLVPIGKSQNNLPIGNTDKHQASLLLSIDNITLFNNIAANNDLRVFFKTDEQLQEFVNMIERKASDYEHKLHVSNLRLKETKLGHYDNSVKSYKSILGNVINDDKINLPEFITSIKDFFKDDQIFASDFKVKRKKAKINTINPYNWIKLFIASNGMNHAKKLIKSNGTAKNGIKSIPFVVLSLFNGNYSSNNITNVINRALSMD